MHTVSDALREHGMAGDRIKVELFASSQPGRVARPDVAASESALPGGRCRVSITLDGATREIDMPATGQSVLDAAIDASLDPPYACKAGVCSTCRALVLEGEVEMAKNHALEDYEVARGYVLTCQCYPLSETVVVSYDR